MAVKVAVDQVQIKEFRELLIRGVTEGLAHRSHQEWKVLISEPADSAEYVIQINGPGGFRWRREFFGPTELTLDYIREQVRKSLRSMKD